MQKIYCLLDTVTGKLVTLEKDNHVMYFEHKVGDGLTGAKEARTRFNANRFVIESECWADGVQVKPYRYEIRRGPDHWKGASR